MPKSPLGWPIRADDLEKRLEILRLDLGIGRHCWRRRQRIEAPVDVAPNPGDPLSCGGIVAVPLLEETEIVTDQAGLLPAGHLLAKHARPVIFKETQLGLG